MNKYKLKGIGGFFGTTILMQIISYLIFNSSGAKVNDPLVTELIDIMRTNPEITFRIYDQGDMTDTSSLTISLTLRGRNVHYYNSFSEYEGQRQQRNMRLVDYEVVYDMADFIQAIANRNSEVGYYFNQRFNQIDQVFTPRSSKIKVVGIEFSLNSSSGPYSHEGLVITLRYGNRNFYISGFDSEAITITDVNFEEARLPREVRARLIRIATAIRNSELVSEEFEEFDESTRNLINAIKGLIPDNQLALR